MTIDLDDIESRINEGIYGDDRMTDTGRDDAFAALALLLDEVERLRAEADEMRRWAEEAAHAENLNAQDAQKERAAVVAWLRRTADDAELHLMDAVVVDYLRVAAAEIERGEHRREEEK